MSSADTLFTFFLGVSIPLAVFGVYQVNKAWKTLNSQLTALTAMSATNSFMIGFAGMAQVIMGEEHYMRLRRCLDGVASSVLFQINVRDREREAARREAAEEERARNVADAPAAPAAGAPAPAAAAFSFGIPPH